MEHIAKTKTKLYKFQLYHRGMKGQFTQVHI